MDQERFERLKELLEQIKKSVDGGVTAETLSPETKSLMEATEAAIKHHGFKYVADNGFGSGTRPPKIPGYDRIPDFAVDRNADGNWDMIIEIKSSVDWNCSDEQLTDLYKFCSAKNLDFWIVVPASIYPQAAQRYQKLGLTSYSKFKLVSV